jgi:hypothetical protein
MVLHNIHVRKLIEKGWRGGCKAEDLPRAPNTFALALGIAM